MKTVIFILLLLTTKLEYSKTIYRGKTESCKVILQVKKDDVLLSINDNVLKFSVINKDSNVYYLRDKVKNTKLKIEVLTDTLKLTFPNKENILFIK